MKYSKTCDFFLNFSSARTVLLLLICRQMPPGST